ncbi:MAG: hypothetical protein KDK05_19940 [Candidatus Competibacteraceae bacterium]|nr:hypothetical protein [Candidatus Competibacteraceae bacterium]
MYKFIPALLWTLLLSPASLFAASEINEFVVLPQPSGSSAIKNIYRDNTCTKSDLRSLPGKQQRLQQLLLQHTLATGMPLLTPGRELTQSINDIAAATAHQQRCMPS